MADELTDIADCREVARLSFQFTRSLIPWTEVAEVEVMQSAVAALARTLTDRADRRVNEMTPSILPSDNLNVGDRVRLATTGPVDFSHGEYGEVASIDPDGDGVRIHLEKYHSSLNEWGNCIIWTSDDPYDDDPVATVVEWLRPQLEIVERCSHYFSHVNNDVTGERVCTTCGAQGFEYQAHLPRWTAADKVVEAVNRAAEFETVNLDGEPYRQMWLTIDLLTTYQLTEQFDTSVMHCESVLRRKGLWK